MSKAHKMQPQLYFRLERSFALNMMRHDDLHTEES